jgi:diacylglycerol kinase (ATP)
VSDPLKAIRIAVIMNGISMERLYFYRKILPMLRLVYKTEIYETLSRNDAISLASKAVDKKYDVIIAAGGDGTVHQVINGVLKGRENYTNLPVIVVFPLGTGNDFARSINIKSDPNQLMLLLKKFEPQLLDVGEVDYISDSGEKDHRYFINVADIGMGPEVVKRVLKSDRTFGSAIAYYISILITFFTYRPVVVTARNSTWNWQGKLRTFAVGNGRYYGHGLCVAPDAKTNDGIFDAFICGDVSVLDFIRYSIPMKAGKHIHHPEVFYKQADAIDFESEKTCLIEADGELLGKLPARVKVSSTKLKVLVP